MQVIVALTSMFINSPGCPSIADLGKGSISEALKYNLIDLGGTFWVFNNLIDNNVKFMNVYAMLSRAAQEATATVLYLSDSPSEVKHKKFCDDVLYNSDLLHYLYHVLEDDTNEKYALGALKDDVWSWTTSKYESRIRKSLGTGEYAFYQYTSALAHYSMINDYYIDVHPEDFEKLRDMFLFKICKYIYLNVCKIVELKIATNPVVIFELGNYKDNAERAFKQLGNYELDELLSLMRFQPHTHEKTRRTTSKPPNPAKRITPCPKRKQSKVLGERE
jgi:uncharacterized protein (UPF0548 family)